MRATLRSIPKLLLLDSVAFVKLTYLRTGLKDCYSVPTIYAATTNLALYTGI